VLACYLGTIFLKSDCRAEYAQAAPEYISLEVIFVRGAKIVVTNVFEITDEAARRERVREIIIRYLAGKAGGAYAKTAGGGPICGCYNKNKTHKARKH